MFNRYVVYKSENHIKVYTGNAGKFDVDEVSMFLQRTQRLAFTIVKNSLRDAASATSLT